MPPPPVGEEDGEPDGCPGRPSSRPDSPNQFSTPVSVFGIAEDAWLGVIPRILSAQSLTTLLWSAEPSWDRSGRCAAQNETASVVLEIVSTTGFVAAVTVLVGDPDGEGDGEDVDEDPPRCPLPPVFPVVLSPACWVVPPLVLWPPRARCRPPGREVAWCCGPTERCFPPVFGARPSSTGAAACTGEAV